MEFDCKYAQPNGEVVRSVHAGHSAEEVRAKLHDQGFLPLSVKARGRGFSFRRKRGGSSIKSEDFIVFNQQFAALILGATSRCVPGQPRNRQLAWKALIVFQRDYHIVHLPRPRSEPRDLSL